MERAARCFPVQLLQRVARDYEAYRSYRGTLADIHALYQYIETDPCA